MKSYSNHKDIQFKSVILFRHGKSDWDAQYDSDHDRPLAKRGIRDAKRMGKFLSKRAEVPELILSSTALRTRETTKLAMEAGNWDVDVELEKKIYEASLEEILIDPKCHSKCRKRLLDQLRPVLPNLHRSYNRSRQSIHDLSWPVCSYLVPVSDHEAIPVTSGHALV